MRRLGTGALAAAVVLSAALPPAVAHGRGEAPGHRVVVDGLDNPRQLNWTNDGADLLVAEAGRGGPECSPDGACAGPSGAVTLVERPGSRSPEVSTPVEGLLSIATAPGGVAAVGVNGVDTTDVPGQYLVAGYDAAGPPMANGSLLVAVQEASDVTSVLAWADLQAAEEELNPDGAQVHSNPYAVLYVDEDPGGAPDGYALVADAGANTVWKVVPDFATQTEEQAPEHEITAWATWPTTALPDGTDDPAGPAEFVPTSLTSDGDGNVYVGGLGSERPGAASVVKFDADGTELDRWDGFTAVTGVAVDGEHLYVSELFGPTPPALGGEPGAEESAAEDAAASADGTEEAADGAAVEAADPGAEEPAQVPGRVVVLHTGDPEGARWGVDVPLPADLATDGRRVYASVNSLAPAEGIPAGAQNPFGAVGGGAVWALDFSQARPVEPVATAGPGR